MAAQARSQLQRRIRNRLKGGQWEGRGGEGEQSDQRQADTIDHLMEKTNEGMKELGGNVGDSIHQGRPIAMEASEL